ncbi:MAG: hypothetical protein DRI80_15960 [Chloroflexota bacterium]|nr:MAG: hypothetical protein DRI80_15960 [Chloroflexota bacterium]
MRTQVSGQMKHEQTLINIARMLPSERVAQLVDFARFLEAQTLVEELAAAESTAEIETDIAKWDALLASEEAQELLYKLADEALEEHKAGQTRPMRFTYEGRIVPG